MSPVFRPLLFVALVAAAFGLGVLAALGALAFLAAAVHALAGLGSLLAHMQGVLN